MTGCEPGAIIESLRIIQRDIERKNAGSGEVALGDVKHNGAVADSLPAKEEGEEADSPQFTWFCKGKLSTCDAFPILILITCQLLSILAGSFYPFNIRTVAI